MAGKLTSRMVASAKPKEKDYKMYDGHCGYLLVKKTGIKLWKADYVNSDGKHTTASFGEYPVVTLSEFRKKFLNFRRNLAHGIDPRAEKKSKHSFAEVAKKWLEKHSGEVTSNGYLYRIQMNLNKHVLPVIGNKAIAEITRLNLSSLLSDLEKKGIPAQARIIGTLIDNIFRYAVNFGYIKESPATRINDVLSKRAVSVPRKAELDPNKFGVILNRIDKCECYEPIKAALRLVSLLAVRSIELREARWSEIDFENAFWTIPAARMKTRKEHVVPLSKQAVAIFLDLKDWLDKNYGSNENNLCFPSDRAPYNAITAIRLRETLHRIIGENLDIHGFRATFSTLCHENRFANSDVIEMCLSHTIGSKVFQVYNRADFMQERRALMQKWADYLDTLKENKE